MAKLKKDPKKYEEFKRKKRESYHANKRLVQDMTPEERSKVRVSWKLRKSKAKK